MIYNYHHSDTLTSINHAPTVVVTAREYLSSNQDSDISIYMMWVSKVSDDTIVGH